MAAVDGLKELEKHYGMRLRRNIPLKRYTTSRVGGMADMLMEISTSDLMVEVVTRLWEWDLPFRILGSGSNVLVSDSGLREIVLINRSGHANRIRFDTHSNPPTIWAISGVNLGMITRQAAQHGLSGLEWAVGIPGTLGGAVVGNAGAFGSDMARILLVAEILQRSDHTAINVSQRVRWSVEQLGYAYRDSNIKRRCGEAIVLSALFKLQRSTRAAVTEKMDEFSRRRHATQPPGASMGSVFKNPPENSAGRLIEAAGLKGSHIGDASISKVHANFITNNGHATAKDIYQLIQFVRHTVAEKFSVNLMLEIELLGEFKE